MTKRINLEKIHKIALDQYEQYLSGLDNVHGLGIVNIEIDSNKQDKNRLKGTNKSNTRLALAVYVNKKVAESFLAHNQKVPKMLDVSVDGKTYTVRTKVIAQFEITFENDQTQAMNEENANPDSFGTDDL